jgi:regulator of protease activity HflC (stomatin/prohibitin superfamily)
MAEYRKEGTFEKPVTTFNGVAMLLLLIIVVVAGLALIYTLRNPRLAVPVAVVAAFIGPGFFMLQPNQAGVLTLFGSYLGTERTAGLRWTLPWNIRKRVSVRARNHNVDQLKVNDRRGNPIEIAAVVVWRVQDTAQALFDVEDFEHFVKVQSESALRHTATRYNYDHSGEDHDSDAEVTLRAGADTIADALRDELQARVQQAGVKIEEAKLTHLAYAPEIAGAMLRRQQAEAVISARAKIVTGAVTMVEMALKSLSEKNVVDLDDERRAAMVSNLMVVLCSERDTQPIVNTGTLYT